MMRTAIRASVVCALVACGGTGGGDDVDEATAQLQIDPQLTEVVLVDGAPAMQAFTATLIDADGDTRDVTAESVFSVDSAMGAFNANTATIYGAGKTIVYGLYDDKAGQAQLIARLESTRVEMPLGTNTPDLFNGPEDPARAPNIVYPPIDVTMPRNLGDFETHWTDANGNNIFEISLKTEYADVRVYVQGGNGDPAAGPMASYFAFKATEWAAAVGIEGTVQYQVRGIDSSNPTSVGASAPRLVRLSNEPMEGGLYYWAAASTGGGAYGIFRHDMAKPGQEAEEFMTTNQTSGRCVACHALSRDGTKMAITYDGGNQNATMVDVATSARQPDTTQWNFATFTPDGSKLLTVFNGTIVVRNTADQAVVGTMPAAGYVSHPDLSPDGTRLVYIRAPAGTDWNFSSGTMYTRSYDPVTHAFGNETPLVVDGVNNFYPSWSPDGQWILFNRSDTGTAYDNANATLWVVKADGSAPPIQLAIANQGLGLTNSWGRWAPFAQTVGSSADPIFWITVSSKRDFGVRLFGTRRPQIWMTPFFPERANGGQDPSTPAFWLPFQNILSNNHIAQWTERVVVTL